MLLKSCGPKQLPKDFFSIEKLPLKICGASFTGNESTAYKIYSGIVIVIFNYSFVILQLITTYKHLMSPEGLDQNDLIYQFASIIGTTKLVVLLCNRRRVGKLFTRLQQAPFGINLHEKDEDKEKLIKKCLFITKFQARVYWISLFIAIIPSQITSFIKRIRSSDPKDWDLPFGSVYPVNVSYTPNYEICWLHEMISIHFNALIAVAPDVVIASILCHLCFHFKILQNMFRRLVEDSYRLMMKDTRMISIPESDKGIKIDPSTVSWKYLNQKFKDAVDYHLAILEVADELEDLFNGLLLMVLLATLGMMGFMVYRAAMIPFNDPRIIRFVLDTPVAAMQVLVVSFWGEKLIHESQKVGDAAYESNFTGTDIRFQKSLVMVIRRSQNATKLTFWKFNYACIATFTWLLQSTYTTFMLLRNTAMSQEE